MVKVGNNEGFFDRSYIMFPLVLKSMLWNITSSARNQVSRRSIGVFMPCPVKDSNFKGEREQKYSKYWYMNRAKTAFLKEKNLNYR